MSRTLKNFLMILILLIMIFINIFTIVKVNDDIYSENYVQGIVMNENTGLIQTVVNNKPSFIHYMLFIGEGIIISGIVMYLIMSKFNKNCLKEIFNKHSKIFLFCLGILIVAVIIIGVDMNIVINIS